MENAHTLDKRFTEQAQLDASQKRLRQLLRTGREQGSSEGSSLSSLPLREAGPEAVADPESAGNALYAASLVTHPINAISQVTHVTSVLAAQSAVQPVRRGTGLLAVMPSVTLKGCVTYRKRQRSLPECTSREYLAALQSSYATELPTMASLSALACPNPTAGRPVPPNLVSGHSFHCRLP